MKLIKVIVLFCLGILFTSSSIFGQANSSLNILTLNSGKANVGGTVYVQVTITATTGTGGQTGGISARKVRPQISVPATLATILSNAQQTGLPSGWTINSNNGSSIVLCNGTDVIPVGQSRVALIKLQAGSTIGGPLTVGGNTTFSNGTLCTSTGSLTGDNIADNSSQSSLEVVAANACALSTLSISAPNVACFGGTTTLTAVAGQFTDVEYSLNGGAFQADSTFAGLSAGTHTVIARKISDTTCTLTSNTITVTAPASALSATATATNVTTPGGNQGTATANPSGGTAGYTYLWTPSNQTTQIATGLTPGTYSVLITDANGCTTTASATVNDIILQPLTLIDFNLKLVNCEPALKWISENEINTDRFEIERNSSTNINWTTVGNVAAKVNTSTKSNYSFTDKNIAASPEQIFYRLKIIDKDGSFKYSKVISLVNNCNSINAFVFPNPVRNGKLKVTLSGVTVNTEATLIALNGQLIAKTKLNNGNNSINVSNAATGEYILIIKDFNNEERIIKVLIEN
jgi:hypothetical protein